MASRSEYSSSTPARESMSRTASRPPRYPASATVRGALALTGVVLASACAETREVIPAASLVLDGCNAVTMRSPEVQGDTTIVVGGDSIAAIGPDGSFVLPASAERIACEGRYVIPGLADAHVHLGHRTELLSYLIAGVTTVFNLGGDHLDLFTGDRMSVLALRDSVMAGSLNGPTIYSTGQSLDGDPPTGPFQRAVSSVDAAAEAVAEQAAAGFDFIKVYDALDPELHAAVVNEANRLKLAVFGHVPEAVGVFGTLTSGQAVISHAEEFYPVLDSAENLDAAARELAQKVKQSGVAVIPNGAFIKGLIRQLEDLDGELSHPEVEYLAPAVRVWWEPRYNYYVNRDDREAFLRRSRLRDRWIRRFVAELHAHGVLLLAGSDAALPVALPGWSLHQELAALSESGLGPYDALRAATADIGAFMAVHRPDDRRFGTIAVGSRADMVVLTDNPLVSLEGLRSIVGLIVRGRWHTADDLRALREHETEFLHSVEP